MSQADAEAALELFSGYFTILVNQATAGCFSRALPEKYQDLSMKGIPDFKVFMRPKLREMDSAGMTLLELLKDAYLKECEKLTIRPMSRFLLQVRPPPSFLPS